MSGTVQNLRSLLVMLVAVLALQTRANADQLLDHREIGGSTDFKIESVLGWSEVPQILFVPAGNGEHHIVLVGKASARITRVSSNKRGTGVITMAAVFDTSEKPKWTQVANDRLELVTVPDATWLWNLKTNTWGYQASTEFVEQSYELMKQREKKTIRLLPPSPKQSKRDAKGLPSPNPTDKQAGTSELVRAAQNLLRQAGSLENAKRVLGEVTERQ